MNCDTNLNKLEIYKEYINGLHEGIKFAIKVLEETRQTMISCGFNPIFPDGRDFVEEMKFKLKQLVCKNPWDDE